jgi:hypothetical protein
MTWGLPDTVNDFKKMSSGVSRLPVQEVAPLAVATQDEMVLAADGRTNTSTAKPSTSIENFRMKFPTFHQQWSLRR